MTSGVRLFESERGNVSEEVSLERVLRDGDRAALSVTLLRVQLGDDDTVQVAVTPNVRDSESVELLVVVTV